MRCTKQSGLRAKRGPKANRKSDTVCHAYRSTLPPECLEKEEGTQGHQTQSASREMPTPNIYVWWDKHPYIQINAPSSIYFGFPFLVLQKFYAVLCLPHVDQTRKRKQNQIWNTINEENRCVIMVISKESSLMERKRKR